MNAYCHDRRQHLLQNNEQLMIALAKAENVRLRRQVADMAAEKAMLQAAVDAAGKTDKT